MKYFKIQKYIIKIKILKSVIQIIIKYFTKKPLKNKQKQKQKKKTDPKSKKIPDFNLKQLSNNQSDSFFCICFTDLPRNSLSLTLTLPNKNKPKSSEDGSFSPALHLS